MSLVCRILEILTYCWRCKIQIFTLMFQNTLQCKMILKQKLDKDLPLTGITELAEVWCWTTAGCGKEGWVIGTILQVLLSSATLVCARAVAKSLWSEASSTDIYNEWCSMRYMPERKFALLLGICLWSFAANIINMKGTIKHMLPLFGGIIKLQNGEGSDILTVLGNWRQDKTNSKLHMTRQNCLFFVFWCRITMINLKPILISAKFNQCDMIH